MVKDEITRIIHDAAAGLGYMIYESSLLLKGADTKIAVKIDKEGVISHQDCELYSQELAKRLDEAEVVPNYSLEVSSPGLKRKIRNLDEFQRFVNAPVKVIVKGDDTNSVIKGKLIDVQGDTLLLLSEGREVSIALQQVVNANLDY